MSEEIIRFSPQVAYDVRDEAHEHPYALMMANPSGKYVDWDDYQKLRAELSAVKKSGHKSE